MSPWPTLPQAAEMSAPEVTVILDRLYHSNAPRIDMMLVPSSTRYPADSLLFRLQLVFLVVIGPGW